MSSVAISIADVSKHFRLAHEQYRSLKEKVIHFRRTPYEEFWALRDIDIEVKEGETVGLIGHNGSGKSTLLKCVAGILRPTSGEIVTRGRVAALLELGAGFQAELTGRENIFLNGTILGMSKREVARRFDEIVAFAELEQFIDTQVRFYSSGMYVRLGFAVAVNVEPDILLIDEVLAVGDEAFQRKCIERVREFQRDGRTIVFVTHSVDLVRKVCDRVAVLDHGHLVALGETGDAVRTFREHLLQHQSYEESADAATLEEIEKSPLRITGVEFVHPGLPERKALFPGEPLEVRVSFDVVEPVVDAEFMIEIYDVEGRLLHQTTTHGVEPEPRRLAGPGTAVFSYDSVPLLDGDYPVTIAVTSDDWTKIYDWHEQRDRFEVLDPQNQPGLVWLPVRTLVAEASIQPATTQ